MTDWLKPTAEVPVPRDVPPDAGAREPNESSHTPGSVKLYRKYPVEAEPFGLPDPFNCADVFVMADAASVVTVGGDGVVNVTTAPNANPAEF